MMRCQRCGGPGTMEHQVPGIATVWKCERCRRVWTTRLTAQAEETSHGRP